MKDKFTRLPLKKIKKQLKNILGSDSLKIYKYCYILQSTIDPAVAVVLDNKTVFAKLTFENCYYICLGKSNKKKTKIKLINFAIIPKEEYNIIIDYIYNYYYKDDTIHNKLYSFTGWFKYIAYFADKPINFRVVYNECSPILKKKYEIENAEELLCSFIKSVRKKYIIINGKNNTKYLSTKNKEEKVQFYNHILYM